MTWPCSENPTEPFIWISFVLFSIGLKIVENDSNSDDDDDDWIRVRNIRDRQRRKEIKNRQPDSIHTARYKRSKIELRIHCYIIRVHSVNDDLVF